MPSECSPARRLPRPHLGMPAAPPADHLTAAAGDAAVHCPHAGGAAPCGDISPAAMYCANYAATCSSADSFADTAACEALYDSYAPGTAGDTSGATQGCIRCELCTLINAPWAVQRILRYFIHRAGLRSRLTNH